ncbi:NAD(P)H-hydrate dehydratase [Camelimonas abortus]|uniref:Bifunctional NAD(P)H-hydrate repair enzyme n=1 Tax=Camelimonas abortus TaxID=1017184 RepID=A0ABV7LF80_9HYPH
MPQRQAHDHQATPAAAAAGLQLLRAAQMAEADRTAMARGAEGYALMLRAGRAVAREAQAMLRAAGGGRRRVLAACGTGGNGGDGYVAARLLREAGFQASVWAPFGPPKRGDAAQAAAGWGGPVAEAPPQPGAFDLVIDALFGAGLDRPLAGAALEAARLLDRLGAPVLAVDVPSGLNADTGQPMGHAVAASATVTFAALKPGHLLLPGRSLCGPVTLADIGIGAQIIADVGETLYANGPELWLPRFPRLSLEAHKYRRGHVLCCSGPALATGAIRLSARAALRAGAGLVTVAAGAEACRVHAAHLTAVMIREAEDAAAFAALLDDPRFNAVVIGPGGGPGPGLVARIAAAAKRRRAMVIDADGLTSFAGRPDYLARTLAPDGAPAPAVLTPHDGEFARVFAGVEAVEEAPSKYGRAVAAAACTGAVVTLKGADTVIAAPDGRAVINHNAPPWLGTAGAGDVLAGVIAGLVAQGMPPFEAACAGVWIHGEAAAACGPGLIAEDLPEAVPAVLARLHEASGFVRQPAFRRDPPGVWPQAGPG